MIDKLDSIIYQTDVSTWKVILLDVSDKNWPRLVCEQQFPNRFEAEAFIKQSEDKLVCGLDSTDYTI